VRPREFIGQSASVAGGDIALRLRRHLGMLICDTSDAEQVGVALYALSDPRDVRAVRYVGQSTAPARRYRQHVRTACLGHDRQGPWWVRQAHLGPLHEWIRILHADGGRLPFMLITHWVPSVDAARLLEQSLITAHRAAGCALLNCEALREMARDRPSRNGPA
jgi:hypothetical protein